MSGQVMLAEFADGTRTYINDRMYNSLLNREESPRGCFPKWTPSKCENCSSNKDCHWLPKKKAKK